MRRLEIAPDDRLMVIGPHPDDETLAAGGLLQAAVAAGAAVRVVCATDGENNAWAQRAVERRWRLGPADRARWGARRREEARVALGVLGISADALTFLGLPDQGLTDALLCSDGMAPALLAREIERFRPTIVAAPSRFDLHPDHNALGVLVRLALADCSVCDPLVLEYVVHGVGYVVPARTATFAVALDAEQVARKRAAIRAHRSQLLLRRRRLLAFATRGEVFFTSDDSDASAAHPVFAAVVERHTLRLCLEPDAGRRALGGRRLYLAGARAGCARWRVRLPAADGQVAVAEIGDARHATRATMRDRADGRSLRVPLRMLRGATSVFVKLERRVGFFDEAGWREIPLGLGTMRTST